MIEESVAYKMQHFLITNALQHQLFYIIIYTSYLPDKPTIIPTKNRGSQNDIATQNEVAINVGTMYVEDFSAVGLRVLEVID